MADVEQTQKMIPFITCEISLCQYVCELVLGVNVLYLDLGVQIDSIKQTIKSNSVGSGNRSHCRASSLYVFPRTATIRSHESSAGIPSNLNPASKEMISDSVELCETEVCFLHIQLIGTNVGLPQMHNVPTDVDFESSRSPAKIGVLKQSQSALFGRITHIAILFVPTCMMNVRDQTR